jgi:hypothetical protein
MARGAFCMTLADSAPGNTLPDPLGCWWAKSFGGFENEARVSAVAENSDDFSLLCGSASRINNLAVYQDSVKARLSLELGQNPVVVLRQDINEYFHRADRPFSRRFSAAPSRRSV